MKGLSWVLLCVSTLLIDAIYVTVEEGVLRGTVDGDVAVFKGVPFSAPPIGELRWRSAQPHAKWDGVRDAIEYGSICPQVANPLLDVTTNTTTSEDCLTLNIWTPNYNNNTDPLPVMLFLHGGGASDEVGASSYPLYHGYNLSLAGTGAVVITANYRIGALGYLAFDGLVDEDGSTGNWGLSDQRAALSWIQKNIAQFGGDATRVTLFGQSAGACFALCHLVSKQSKGLFSSAILESGVSTEKGFPPITLSEALATGKKVVSAAGCKSAKNVLACMRGVSASKLVAVSSEQNYWLPVIDFVQIEDLPENMIAAGQFNNVPVMLGANLNDTSLGVALIFPAIFEWEYDAYILATFGISTVSQQVKKYYPYNGYKNGVEAIGAITNDQTMTCLTRNVASNLAKYGAQVYLYEFAYPPKTNGPFNTKTNLGAYHGAEVVFVFNNVDLYAETKNDEESKVLAQFMSSTWVTFASSSAGNTENPLNSFWPTYNESSDAGLFVYGTVVQNGAVQPHYEAKSYGNAHNCQLLWDDYLAKNYYHSSQLLASS